MSISPLMPVYPRCGVRPVRGEHCHLIDEDGTRYLDFASGIAVNLLGHSHEGLIKAIQHQTETLMHVSNLYGSPQGEGLAQALVDNTFADMATISASNQEKMHHGFSPLLAGFKYAEFDDLDAAKAHIGPNTAGFLVEPIQGEGGIRPASESFMHGLRELADEHDLMLVLDEVQCGVARTGTLYAYEQYGIEPDILATAKGIGGGFPLGACLATEKAARGMVFGTHGSTYGGNPLAMAAGSAVMDAVASDEFLGEVREKGERLRSRLEQFIGNYPELFEPVRGKGLMLGIKMKVESRPFFVHLRDNHKLLTVAAGDNTLRVLPPLVIGDAEIDEFFEKLSAGAASYQPAA